MLAVTISHCIITKPKPFMLFTKFTVKSRERLQTPLESTVKHTVSFSRPKFDSVKKHGSLRL